MTPQEKLAEMAALLPDSLAREVLNYARYLMQRDGGSSEPATEEMENPSPDLSTSEIANIWDDEFDD